MSCDVLRCGGPTDHVLEVQPADAPLHQVVVCEQHKQAMDGGEPWYISSSENVIYMGEDLRVRNLKRLVNVKSSTSDERLSGVEDYLNTITLELTTIGGDGDVEPVQIVLTREARDQLTWLLGIA